MKRIVVTNNKKVKAMYSDKAEVIFLDNASDLSVLQEGKRIASEGGRLLLDPSRNKGYYRSLVFFKEDGAAAPEEKSLSLLGQCIAKAPKPANDTPDREPLLAGILQKKDLDIVKKILA